MLLYMEPSGSLVPSAVGETFEPPKSTRVGRQVLLDFGVIDVDSKNLVPVEDCHQILGSTSDMTTVYDSSGSLSVGDTVVFRPNYMGVAMLMASGTIQKDFL